MFKKLTQFAVAFLLLWAGSHLANMMGMPLIGQNLLNAGVQAAVFQVDPAKPPHQSQAPGAWSLQVHMASVQPIQRAGAPWNESNDGFAVRYAFDDTYAVQVGHYRNEHTVQGFNFFTNYLYGDYTPLHFGPMHLGAFAGVVSGYDDCTINSGKVTAMTEVGMAPKTGLVGRYQGRNFNTTLRLNPQLRHAGPASLSAEIGFSFK